MPTADTLSPLQFADSLAIPFLIIIAFSNDNPGLSPTWTFYLKTRPRNSSEDYTG